MFFRSLLMDGARGLDMLNPSDISEYGIDWEKHHDPAVMNQLLDREESEWDDVNPFMVHPNQGPQKRPHVPCDPPEEPLFPWEIQELDMRLAGLVDITSQNMQVRRLLWKKAFQICGEILGRRQGTF